MASSQIPPSAGENDSKAANHSKKQAKKEAHKAEKAAAAAESMEADPFSGNYGDVPTEEIQSKAISGRQWMDIGSLDAELAGRAVLIRGFAQVIRPVTENMVLLVVRHSMSTVRCLLVVNKEGVSSQMVKFATGLSKESVVDVEGVVSIPKDLIEGTTQQVEVQVRKLFCVNRAMPNLPFNIEDAARSEMEFENAEQTGEQLVRVGEDMRLNFRFLDLRIPANQGIF